jgi:hypothetical protein
MSKEHIIQSLKSARSELDNCRSKSFSSAAIPLDVLTDVLESHNALQTDIEDLAIKYASLIQSAGDLFFWAQITCASARPAKKGRSFVSEEAVNKLTDAVNKHAGVNTRNKLSEQPINIVSQ